LSLQFSVQKIPFAVEFSCIQTSRILTFEFLTAPKNFVLGESKQTQGLFDAYHLATFLMIKMYCLQ